MVVKRLKNFIVTDKDRYIKQSPTIESQEKWYKDGYFIKKDNVGYESIAEYVVSEFGKCTDLNILKYRLCTINGENSGCYSKNFLKPGEQLISVKYIVAKQMVVFRGMNNYIQDVIAACSDYTGIDKKGIAKYFSDLSKLDAIIFNEDRHFGNIAFIQGNNGFRLAPIFDNGLSLLAYTLQYRLDANITDFEYYMTSKMFFREFMNTVKYFNDISPIKLNIKKLENINWVRNGRDIELNRALNTLLYGLRKSRGVCWNEN